MSSSAVSSSLFSSFSPRPRYLPCSHCTLPLKKPQLCSLCQSTAYCDKECQSRHWSSVHHSQCSRLQKTRSLLLKSLENNKENPWNRWTRQEMVEKDYFTLVQPEIKGEHSKQSLFYRSDAMMAEKSGLDGLAAWISGAALPSELQLWNPLISEAQSEEERWNLAPLLPVDSGSAASVDSWWPESAAGKKLANWSQYCSWRRLSNQSYAPLLLHSPLSLYNAILSSDYLMRRDELIIHLVGLQGSTQWNSLPLYRELALLLPQMKKVKIIVFGMVSEEMEEIRRLRKDGGADARVLLSYRAPEKLGGCELTIELSGHNNSWGAKDCDEQGGINEKPQLVFAHNVNLPAVSKSTTQPWKTILYECLNRSISFVCTELEENTIELSQKEVIPPIIQSVPNQYKISPKDVKNKLNGFRCPAAKPRFAPAFSNGFLLIVHSV